MSQPLPIASQPFPIAALRAEFPALARQHHGQPIAFLDGPAGSQVPRSVITAMGDYLAHCSANCGGEFATSRETVAMLDAARAAGADLFGADDPDCVIFGANMTTLTLGLSRALARTWQPGDEVVVTHLDHDANVTPWLLAARDAGATVHKIGFHREDATLDLDALRAALSPRTRLVAVGAASNATGTINPVEEITRLAHAVGAEVFIDAVHLAPHALCDVAAWGCDYAVCSAYKFFGPHLGLLWGTRARLATLPSYQVRAAGDALPDRWHIGTQSHEAIAGTLAAIEYLAALGRRLSPSAYGRRLALIAAYQAIVSYERELASHLLDGLGRMPGYRVWGIRERARIGERVPTISFTHAQRSTAEIAHALGDRGIFVWHGHYYAIDVTEYLGLEPGGMVRVGLLHYNTHAEIDRLLDALDAIDRDAA